MTQDTVRFRRVLHVVTHYRPELPGQEIFLERSSAVMQEIAPGTSHELLVTRTPRPARETAACTTLTRVTYLSPGEAGTWRRQMALALWLVANLHRYESVHFRAHADWYFVSYLLTRLAGRRLVLSAHGEDSLPVLIGKYPRSLRRLARHGFGLFRALVTSSPQLLQETRQVADEGRCHLIPSGITLPETTPGEGAGMREQLGIGAEDFVLVFVGELSTRRNPHFLVEAMPAILAEHPQAHLLLVGPAADPSEAQALRALVAREGLGERVHFLGEQRDLNPCLAASDLLVLAAHREPGAAVPEAMSHGLPVVARRLPGIDDGSVLDGETGFVFEDRVGYVAAVNCLLRDAEMRRRFGAAGRNLAAARFGMAGVAANYLRVYGTEPELPPARETGLGCTASILDTRFHTPVEIDAGAPPLLITMVDAEEAFDWSAPFSRDAQDVTSMGEQWRAHRIFERHGVVPLYLVDHPVAVQDAGRAPLRDLLRDGGCEIGAQLHPWVTPPFEESLGERNSYAGNLPVALEFAKARQLTGTLEDSFGEAPRIFRTGRFGAGPRTADILKALGYTADSSVTPCWPPEGMERPWLSARPYWADREQRLMEIPVSAALVGRLSHATALAPLVFHPRAQRSHASGVMSRLGLMERIRLSPEGMTIEEAKRLTRHMLAEGHRVFVLTYHSPSLVPGNTPYVRTREDLARFLGWLDEFYAFFASEARGRSGSWRELRYGPMAKTAMAAQ